MRVNGVVDHGCRHLAIYLNPMNKVAKDDEIQKLITRMLKEQSNFRFKLIEKMIQIEEVLKFEDVSSKVKNVGG